MTCPHGIHQQSTEVGMAHAGAHRHGVGKHSQAWYGQTFTGAVCASTHRQAQSDQSWHAAWQNCMTSTGIIPGQGNKACKHSPAGVALPSQARCAVQ
eukprot:1158988-Pelagomonas_calceolata.AAC.11